MKRSWSATAFLGSLIAICSLLTSSVQAAVDVNPGDVVRFFNGPGDIGGGEFGADNLTSNGAAAGFPGDFITFCVQTAEHLDFHPAGFIVNSVTTNSVVNQGVPLASGTAYLYTLFRNGVLSTLNGLYGSGDATEDIADANALQRAIWHLQFGESLGGDLEAIDLVAQANAAILGGTWSGIGAVRIANITWATARGGFAPGDPAQDVLVLVPEPASLVVWSLIGGCVAVGRYTRRRRSAVTA